MAAARTGSIIGALGALGSMSLTGRVPNRRSVAAVAKLCGMRLERSWPFLRKSEQGDLNLGFIDLLEFQFARSREAVVLVVGAFDGITNDPTGEFIRERSCRAIFVEPQPAAFARLRSRLGSEKGVELLNAAIDEQSGQRVMYTIPAGVDGLPSWTEQLASFHQEHLLRHEDRAPGLSRHIVALHVEAVSFDDLLDRYQLDSIDVLQIDAEGMDAKLLSWFPFERIRPQLLYYEVAHMSAVERAQVSARLAGFGYRIYPSESVTDDMAIIF